LGRQHSDPSLQANEPSQLPAKTGFKFNIYTPAGRNGWRAPAGPKKSCTVRIYHIHHNYNVDLDDYDRSNTVLVVTLICYPHPLWGGASLVVAGSKTTLVSRRA